MSKDNQLIYIIHSDGAKCWYFNDLLHCEDGPAIEDANGDKCWYLNGKQYTEEEYLQEMQRRNSPTFDGKVVEIDGKKYKLTLV